MKTLRDATIAVLAGFTLAACSSGMQDDEMMEKDKKMSMSEDKMSEGKMMSEDKMMSDSGMMMPAGVMVETSSMGKVLTDKMGMTLYTFDKDHAGMSNCYGNCAANWPPLMASKDAEAMGGFSVITRKDGSMQWALDGMPLYTWVKDSKPGDVTGDGVGGVWHAAMAPGDEMTGKMTK